MAKTCRPASNSPQSTLNFVDYSESVNCVKGHLSCYGLYIDVLCYGLYQNCVMDFTKLVLWNLQIVSWTLAIVSRTFQFHSVWTLSFMFVLEIRAWTFRNELENSAWTVNIVKPSNSFRLEGRCYVLLLS